MSGTGQHNTTAPTRLTPISVDQPIGQDQSGNGIFPSLYFAQSYTRVLAFLGDPSSSSSSGGSGTGGNMTVVEQLDSLTTTVSQMAAQVGAGLAALAARVDGLEAIVRAMRDAPLSQSVAPAIPGFAGGLAARVDAIEGLLLGAQAAARAPTFEIAPNVFFNGGAIAPYGTVTPAAEAAHTLLGNSTGSPAAASVVDVGAGLFFSGPSLEANWSAPVVTAIGTGITITSGTIHT